MYSVLEEKFFETEESINIVEKGIKQGILTVFSLIPALPDRLEISVKNATVEFIPDRWIILDKKRLQQLREHCAMAAATHRHIALFSPEVAQLPRFCASEIMWSNGSVPLLTLRMSGRSLEDYSKVLKGIDHFKIESCQLLVPAVELLSLWNLSAAISGEPRLTIFMLKMMKLVVSDYEEERDNYRPVGVEGNNTINVLYIYGCSLSAIGNPRDAVKYFKDVIRIKPYITEDRFLVPYAKLELAMCHHALGQTESARVILIDVKANYFHHSKPLRFLYRLYHKIIVNEDDPTTSPPSTD
ncbi:PREDICTED: tetratricopeptide repeat protein 39A-like [Papilio xuthus]|uniref:Tetratricopeptide repeat protein 39A-like n=1 Tax=Papilio xuthus TaxID=66420 RepID=A0AAJ7EJ88_PAPXU|nr:PREDICTED: tetratricopeptide repeat protein 39A-like [Papilio xuthus]XP_013179447.1 PREDICTED: tetratricopeptide repeat protein 39A-like [Papilio xuthus]XP_013179448.1 PREDICTED: tetratricopeptide repeat protein 39A-like [Papilio xuthus]XP_013179450.1 PREDICTED: tetratricopeptide repeat protein 39A-like [Papilio xuthus]XP_013179451.1 PREDICTED: tetratricopeptide repeat protein 39A-like [Papilio xuthus]